VSYLGQNQPVVVYRQPTPSELDNVGIIGGLHPGVGLRLRRGRDAERSMSSMSSELQRPSCSNLSRKDVLPNIVVGNALGGDALLQMMSISHCGLGGDGSRALALALKKFHSLTEFSLSNISGVDDASAKDIVEALAGHAQLQFLTLMDCNVGLECCGAIGRLLQTPSSILQQLLLGANFIGGMNRMQLLRHLLGDRNFQCVNPATYLSSTWACHYNTDDLTISRANPHFSPGSRREQDEDTIVSIRIENRTPFSVDVMIRSGCGCICLATIAASKRMQLKAFVGTSYFVRKHDTVKRLSFLAMQLR